MIRCRFALTLAVTLVVALATATQTLAAAPLRDSDAYTETFADDFILELCGIETNTTLTERWTFKEFADGSATLHVVRTFVPEDPRIPVEQGAATSFIAPDGSRTVIGSPTRLFDPEGGIRLIDAGRGVLDENGELVSYNGQLMSVLADDLAPYYCP